MQERFACNVGNGCGGVIAAARNTEMSGQSDRFYRFTAFKIGGG
jgi:hypothetical protein